MRQNFRDGANDISSESYCWLNVMPVHLSADQIKNAQQSQLYALKKEVYKLLCTYILLIARGWTWLNSLVSVIGHDNLTY